MNATHIGKKEIINYLRDNIIDLYLNDTGISWYRASQIPVDFSKFYHYPPAGIYNVELLLKIYKQTSKYKAIWCYFIDLENEDNIFTIPAFKRSGCYIPMIDYINSIQDINLGAYLQIELKEMPKSNYLKWESCKILF